MADALFAISRDSGATWDIGDQGFDAQASDTLLLRLRNRPSSAGRVRFQVWDASGYNPAEDVIGNPPRKSPGAPDVTLTGTTTGTSVSPATPDDPVSLALTASRFVAYLVRAVVDDGQTLLADGRLVRDLTKIHQRMVVVRDANNLRPIIASETTEYEDDGWAAAFNALITGPTGPTGGTGPTGPTGTSVATGTGQGFISRELFANASSSKVGATICGCVVQASPANLTLAMILARPGNWFDIATWGASGSAGPGNLANFGIGESRPTATGSGGCCRTEKRYSRKELIDRLTLGDLAIACPLGGAKKTGSTTGSTVTGNAGGMCAVGDLVSAGGGGAGGTGFGSNPGGAGGGRYDNGAPASDLGSTKGGGAPSAGVNGWDGVGAGALANSRAAPFNSGNGGAAGGSEDATTLNGADGGDSDSGGPGGGSGGAGGDVAIPGNGGKGGGSKAGNGTFRGSGPAGGIQPGGIGTDGADMTDWSKSGEAGSGGAGTNVLNEHGGDGGDGGFPGGGAGAGGTGYGPNGTAWGGQGGKGGDAAWGLTAWI